MRAQLSLSRCAILGCVYFTAYLATADVALAAAAALLQQALLGANYTVPGIAALFGLTSGDATVQKGVGLALQNVSRPDVAADIAASLPAAVSVLDKYRVLNITVRSSGCTCVC